MFEQIVVGRLEGNMMSGESTTLTSVDIKELLELLPHRYPFLMIDKIVDMVGDESAVGIKNVTVNEPQFMGHFPGHPVMPGVLMIEGMAQTAGALCVHSRKSLGVPPVVYLMTVDKAKFRKPSGPGDVIEYHVNKIRSRGSIWKFACIAKVDGIKIAEAEIGAMLVDG